MSELEQRARKRFEKWMLEELHYDLVNEGLRHDDLGSYRYLEVQSSWMAWKYSENSVVRSIISGMEAHLIILRAEARQGTNHRERISELTNWVAGLKKEYLEK